MDVEADMSSNLSEDGYFEALKYGGNMSSMTAEEEILSLLGPPRDSLNTVIPMTLVYIMILVTGLVGNLCTCFVIVKNRYMHTTVNFYLFSLAVSDLLLLIVGLPTELWAFWQKYPYVFGETFCVLRALISEACSYASVLTITAFTVERYIAICHPLKAHTMAQLPRAIKAILFIWVIATLSSIPISLQVGIIYQISKTRKPLIATAQCALKNRRPYAFTISTVIFFVLPMSLILGFYFLIGLQLRRSSKSMSRASASASTSLSVNQKTFVREFESESRFGTSDHSRNTRSSTLQRQASRNLHSTPNGNNYRQHAASRRAVVKMLVAVVLAFFICWAPFHAQRLMATHVTEATPAEEMIFTVLTHISGITYYVSATINPILYSIMSLKFRQAFKDTLGRCYGRRPTGNHFDDRTYYQPKSQV